MPRQRRFPVSIEFWTTEEHEAAFTKLAGDTLLTKADLYRMAFDLFLKSHGLLPLQQSQPSPNGHAMHRG